MHKEMSNAELAGLFRAVAAAYEVKDNKGLNKFRIIAYNRAADSFEHLTSEAKDLWRECALDQIPGLGESMLKYLDELFRTGTVKHFDEVLAGLPEAMFEFLNLPGVGAKTAYRLATELGIKRKKDALKKLLLAAQKGKISRLEGFGEKTEEEIIEAVKEVKTRSKRHLLPYVAGIAARIVDWLKKEKSAKRVDPLGSLRRQVATVGDIDIAVASYEPKKVIEHFKKYPQKIKVLEAGEKTASLLLTGGVQVDLMVQPPEAYGALLQHFTGSKHHNVALRIFAQKKGLSLSEYGIRKKGRLYKFATEEDFYKFIGLAWIPPELREDKGEIEAALTGKLPRLVTLSDIKGDLHLHSNFPKEGIAHDAGADSFEEMLEKAEQLGYEYILFTEHNLKSDLPESKVLSILAKKHDLIEKLNEKCEKCGSSVKRIFNGLEIDIKPNGDLAIPKRGFQYLDFAVVSVHSSFRGSKKSQTKRVLEGLSHPKAKILGHPSGRKLGQRGEMNLDWEKIFEFCLKANKWLEINSFPDRLDLPDNVVYEAVKKGVKLVISTDAHEASQMNLMRYGVSVARRGWAGKKDIVNTKSLSDFRKSLGV